jgi:ketosteroid isomerase-like protein
VDRGEVSAWLSGYERAWRAPGTSALAGLFTEDAGYRQDPYAEPVTGLPAITAMWEAERDGPDEVFEMASEVIAADGDTAVARVMVWYGRPVRQEYRDLWVMRFAADGRCAWFEEWPFWPEQPRQAGQPGQGPGEGSG